MAGVLGRKEALTIKEERSQGLGWAQVAGTAGSVELGLQGSQGWTQLLHHPQIPCDDPGGELAHLVRPPSPLPSAFSRCPQDDRPVISVIPPTSQDPVLPSCRELAAAQWRGEGLHVGIFVLISLWEWGTLSCTLQGPSGQGPR